MVVTPTEPMTKVQLPEPIAPLPSLQPSDGASEQGDELIGLKRILVAVDGSANGKRAAQAATRFARDYRAELIVLRVVQAPTMLTPSTPRAGGGPAILKEYYHYAEKEARNYVESVVAEAKDRGVSIVKGEVLGTASSPASTIVGRAKGEGADLIVIGSRGLDRSRRLLLGSVSGSVVANSRIAVLVVK
jgi:nucleotide-binding universal stress UspA family protein